jgi:hypothetical protein
MNMKENLTANCRESVRVAFLIPSHRIDSKGSAAAKFTLIIHLHLSDKVWPYRLNSLEQVSELPRGHKSVQ